MSILDIDYTLFWCRFGRKALLIQGGIQMTICQIVTAAILATKMDKATGTMPAPAGKAVLAFICLFVAGLPCVLSCLECSACMAAGIGCSIGTQPFVSSQPFVGALLGAFTQCASPCISYAAQSKHSDLSSCVSAATCGYAEAENCHFVC